MLLLIAVFFILPLQAMDAESQKILDQVEKSGTNYSKRIAQLAKLRPHLKKIAKNRMYYAQLPSPLRDQLLDHVSAFSQDDDTVKTLNCYAKEPALFFHKLPAELIAELSYYLNGYDGDERDYRSTIEIEDDAKKKKFFTIFQGIRCRLYRCVFCQNSNCEKTLPQLALLLDENKKILASATFSEFMCDSEAPNYKSISRKLYRRRIRVIENLEVLEVPETIEYVKLLLHHVENHAKYLGRQEIMIFNTHGIILDEQLGSCLGYLIDVPFPPLKQLD